MGVVRAVITFGDCHTSSIAACEGNLRFPSLSLPNLNPVAETTGKMRILLYSDCKIIYFKRSPRGSIETLSNTVSITIKYRFYLSMD